MEFCRRCMLIDRTLSQEQVWTGAVIRADLKRVSFTRHPSQRLQAELIFIKANADPTNRSKSVRGFAPSVSRRCVSTQILMLRACRCNTTTTRSAQ